MQFLRLLLAVAMLHAAGPPSVDAAAPADPLRLQPWLSNEPLPAELLARATAAAAARSGSLDAAAAATGPGRTVGSRLSSLAGRMRRRLLQPLLQPGTFAVAPGLPTSSAISAWATVDLDPNNPGASIPRDFLGISHEWRNVEELNHGGTYLQLLQDLAAYGSGPLVIRVGGGSTDLQRDVPPAATWDALRQLHEATGFRFIFGLNFEAQNVTLAKQQMDAIQANLPWQATIAYEVGNEPNFYASMGGRSGAEWVNCCFVNQWGIFGIHLSCRNGAASCVDGQLAGPAWGHVKMAPATLDWFLRVNYRWVQLVTVHWYQATRADANTAASLLDEGPLRAEMANLKQLVQTSRNWGKALRVAEMNTISNSGQRGLSNSFAAALWTLDGAFEAAAAGAVGINLHWGDGASLYAALLRQGSGASIVKPPYYAYLLFQMALGSGAAFMGVPSFQPTPGARLKVWPLKDAATGAARVVLINKDASATAGAFLRLPAGNYGDGKLVRLVGGPRGLSEEWRVSLGNLTYTIGGQPFGVPAGEVVARAQDGSYTIVMPPASAALLIVPTTV